jgi:PAS domain S-box-containing protein
MYAPLTPELYGFLMTDACGNYITVNPKACEMLGYTQDELLQLNVRNLVSPDEWQTVERNFAELVAGQTLQIESCLRHANGSYIFVELQVKRLIAGRRQILMRDITECKRTEEALRISQARLRKVATNLPGVIYQLLLRPDGSQQMLYISSGCRELLELEPEAIQQDIDLLNSLTHPDDLQAFNDSGTTSARTLQPWHYEGRIITPSRKLKWIQGISRPEKLAGGEILWDGLLLDITQRKQAEEQLRQYQEHLEELVAQRTVSLQKANEQLSQEIAERQQVEVALRESEARFRAAAEGSLDAFFILQCVRDEMGHIVDFTFADLNSNAEKMISMSKEEVIGKRLCELIPINRTAGFFEKYVRVVETQTVLEEEFPISTPEISATRLHHQVVPLPDGVAITSRDISEGKSAEEALRESEEKYRLLFSRELDAISFAGALRAIALFDVETGQFLDVNEAFVKLYGYTKEEALSLTPADVSAEPENDSHPWTDSEVELIQAVANQLAIAIDQAELYKQSRLATAIAQAQTQQLEQTLRELKNTQAQLIQNEKMSSLGQMVAGVAHEINNPVSFIYGNVDFASHYFQDLLSLIELYQQEYPQPTPRIQKAISSIDLEFLVEDLQKLLGSIKLGAERIRNIVVSLRNFSRLNEVKLKPIDIHNGLDDTLLILQHRLRQQGKRPEIVVIKQYAQLPLVASYASQLNQVFMNILSNAIDALQETYNKKETSDVPLTITIRTQALDSDWVSIRIADNGCGMSEEVLSRIFDPFFTTKPVGSGTGLGLSISYSIVVDKHQGQLQCHSSPGQGTEFIISIPIRQRKTNSLAVV